MKKKKNNASIITLMPDGQCWERRGNIYSCLFFSSFLPLHPLFPGVVVAFFSAWIMSLLAHARVRCQALSASGPVRRTTGPLSALISICAAVITAISAAVCVCLGYLSTQPHSPAGLPRA